MANTILEQQNPWRRDASWEAADPQLSDWRSSPAPWEPEVLRRFDLGSDLVYTLRGPRQVGKTTLLKLLLRKVIRSGTPPECAVYLDCERAGIEKRMRLQRLLETAVDETRKSKPRARLSLFLDEVTSVQDWATAVKALADSGRLRGVDIVATGSHAADVKRGVERMPGRRGAASGLDQVLLPMSFREYLGVLHGARLGRLPSLADLRDFRGVHAAAASVEAKELIEEAFRAYLLTGGYPRPAAAFKKEGKIPAYVYEIYEAAVLGMVRRLGHRESYFRELFSYWLRAHPNPLDWRDVSRETDIGKHDTAREYAEDLEAAYFWDIAFRSHSFGNPRPAFRGAKKISIKDPFSFHTFRAWALGYGDAWAASLEFLADPAAAGALVESVVGAHLKRRYGPFLLYWRNKKEIDFMGYKENRLEAAVEVKYARDLPRESKQALSDIGGGLLLSRDQLYWDPDSHAAVIPASLFLALL